MRMRYRKARDKTSTELVVRLARRETWDAGVARTLRSCTKPYVVRMGYDVGGRRDDVTFRYDVSGLRSLRTILRDDVLGGDFLVRAMGRMAELLDWRGSRLTTEPYVCWLPAFVYVDASGDIRFVVAPIRGVRPKRQDSALGLLNALSDTRHVRYGGPDDIKLAERMREFAICEDGTLSHMRLRAFVEELATTHDADGPAVAEGTCVVADASGRQRWRLEGGRSYAMGRAATNDICVRDSATVSRRHATLQCDGGAVVVRDLDSMNGTFVDGHRLSGGQCAWLRPGQTFSLSGEVFRIERG